MHPGVAYARSGAIRGSIIGGLGGGALGATIKGLPKKQTDQDTGKEKKLTNKERRNRAIKGGLVGGATGVLYGGRLGFALRAHKWNSGFRPAAGTHGIPKPKTPDWLKGVESKADARRAFHAQARKLHPDLGGSEDAIKKLNQEWETHEPMFKKAMYDAFADELEKISSLGALIGGYAGHKIGPKSAKGQIYSVLGGAAVGHLAGKGLGAAKKQFVDEQAARDRETLYGYTSPPNATDFY